MLKALLDRGWDYSDLVEEGFISSKKEGQQLVRSVKPARKVGWGAIYHGVYLNAVIDFMEKHKRWPLSGEWRNSNRLPSLTTIFQRYRGIVWRGLPDARAYSRIPRENPMSELQRDLARHPRLKPYMALLLPNATHRRDAMARFSDVELVRHMTLLDDDPEVGILYRMKGQTMLRVVNSTPEPDSSHAVYVLAAPPEMKKAQQALAWSFGVTEGWQKFKIETQT